MIKKLSCYAVIFVSIAALTFFVVFDLAENNIIGKIGIKDVLNSIRSVATSYKGIFCLLLIVCFRFILSLGGKKDDHDYDYDDEENL